MIYGYAESKKYVNDMMYEAATLCDSFGIPVSNHPVTGKPMPLGWNDQRDAFRHAYASAITAFEQGKLFAYATGSMYEVTHPNSYEESNMDLWNNYVGREIGALATTREEIAQKVYQALQDGLLITDTSDSRSYNDIYGTKTIDPMGDPNMLMPSKTGSDLMTKIHSLFTSGENTGLVAAGSPIILDLDKDGIETTALTSGTYFDLDNNGFAEQTGWADSGDGLLAIDKNNNGTIDNGTELFGNNTLLADGTKASNGFQALAELDSNTDGKIDANDTAYSQLRIWQDIDEDGYTSEGELKTLISCIEPLNSVLFC